MTNVATSFREMAPPWKPARSDQRPQVPAGRLVIQDRGTHEHPIEVALRDDRLLAIFVGVHVPQQQRHDDVIEQEAAMPAAVACADARDGDQSLHAASRRMAATRARVAAESSVTSRKGLAGVPSADITASQFASARSSAAWSSALPSTRMASSVLAFAGDRTRATGACPRCFSCWTIARPVPPVAPRTRTLIAMRRT